MTKIYLKRQSGISIETLRDSLERNKIYYTLETVVGDDKYFRVTIVKVRADPEELFKNQGIIPSVQQRIFKERENCIEINATYNFIVGNATDLIPENDGDHVKLTGELAQRIKQRRSPPIDKIKIFRED